MSGFAERSHRSRLGSRRLTLLMLKVAIFMPDKSSGWCRRSGLSCSSAALVDPRITRAEAGQHFVADGAEMVREFVDGDALAKQRHHVTPPHALVRQIGDSAPPQSHRDPAP